MPSIAETLIDSARARSLTVTELARELAEPVAQVQRVMADLAATLYPGTRAMPSPAMTFDQLMARHGRASAAGSLTGPSRALQPAGWCGEAGAPIYAVAPKSGADYYRYPVAVGDNPSKIAYEITGSGSLGAVRQLLDANPAKPKVGTPGTWSYNFKSLVAGEKINLPHEWEPYLGTDGSSIYYGTKGVPYPSAPTGTPGTPSTPSAATYTASLPAGAIQATKVKLGAFNASEKTGLAYPSGFDLNDAIDESFRQAVRVFQGWALKKGLPLPQDGALDPATHAAIMGYAPGTVPTVPGIVPTVPTGLDPLPVLWNPDAEMGQKSAGADGSSGTGALLLLALAGFFLMSKGR